MLAGMSSSTSRPRISGVLRASMTSSTHHRSSQRCSSKALVTKPHGSTRSQLSTRHTSSAHAVAIASDKSQTCDRRPSFGFDDKCACLSTVFHVHASLSATVVGALCAFLKGLQPGWEFKLWIYEDLLTATQAFGEGGSLVRVLLVITVVDG